MTKPDLMAELAEVSRRAKEATLASDAKAMIAIAFDALDIVHLRHAELEAVARDAAIGRAYLRWYAAAEGYRNVIADAAHEAIMAEAMHNSAREG